MNYYDIRTHVSNSDLNALRKAMNASEDIADLQKHYSFGNLVDASVTEKWRIDGNTLDVESGGLVSFEDERIQTAAAMADAYHARADLKQIFDGAVSQYAFFRNRFEIEHEGIAFEMAVKCKLDLLRRGVIGGDIKSTACTSSAQFKDSIYHFNYDQQSAWYMDIARLDRFMIIGLGKKRIRGEHPVFTHLINRGDGMYNSGKEKYSRLALKHHFLLGNFFL